jgi:hypothetical protein
VFERPRTYNEGVVIGRAREHCRGALVSSLFPLYPCTLLLSPLYPLFPLVSNEVGLASEGIEGYQEMAVDWPYCEVASASLQAHEAHFVHGWYKAVLVT